MDFDDAKENIQPLAQGRNASILQASLKLESPQELLERRKELEKEIRSYTGDDPLSAWYNYIEWIEQSFPSGGKESGLQEVLSKCLSHFESDEKYKQDCRMIRLYIKFIDSHKDPAECYQQLFNAGIGTMVADFYIAWAYCYDLVGNHRKADEIFRRGIACRAQPLDDLISAHQHFGFTVAQRFLYKDDDNVKEETNRQLHERRLALTSLRGHRRKQQVGSIRTGAAVKNYMPGTIKSDAPSTSSHHSNVRVQVFKDENDHPNILLKTPPSGSTENTKPEESISVVRSIIDAARNQENQKEPGPWNRAHLGKRGKLFGKKTKTTNELGFEIHVDELANDKENVKKPCLPPILIAESDIKFDKPFVYPANFCARSLPIKGWYTPVTTEENLDKNTLVQYSKCKLYPRPNVEFSPEELKAFNIMKKLGIENNFTKERETYWGCGPDYQIRLYPHFATQSKTQILDAMDVPYIPDYKPANLKFAFNEIYNETEKVERSFEEILALKIKRNETTINPTDMEETMCVTSERQKRRKSFFPMRKSLAPSAIRSVGKVSVLPECIEKTENQINECEEKFIAEDISKSAIKITEDVINKTTPDIVRNMLSETKAISPKTKISTVAADEPLKSTETTVAENCAKPFEIYHDESVVEITNNLPTTSSSSSIKPAETEDYFKFKTPALPLMTNPPPMSTSLTKSNKVHFEIFEDENTNTNKISPNNIPKPLLGCGSGVFFDPEETCSTQTFNTFLKAQSVSTPKAIAKTQPQRLFGNILKEVPATTTPEPQEKQQQEKEEEQQQFVTVASVNDHIATENSPASAAGYSPPRQQLSTILEMSEHGTTQGTHTTGATTKSTFSSPEFEIESRVQSTTAARQTQVTAAVALETVKESSSETTTIKSPTENLQDLMSSLEIQNISSINSSKQNQQQSFAATPAAVRLQQKSQGGGLDFSIFEDDNEKSVKHVGNFTRLQEKEETASDSVFKTLAPIRFQDDKTETISKMLMAPLQAVQYPEDKTETISKMLMAPIETVQFPEDKTETISKMLLAPPQPIKFPDEETETISKFILAPASQPIIFQDDENDRSVNKLSSTAAEPMQQDDSFQFFGESPPKIAKPMGKQFEKIAGPLAQIRIAADARTPLTFETKRFCNKLTPDIQKSNKSKQAALFEDELSPHNAVTYKKELKKLNTNSKDVVKDVYMPEFSLIEGSQQAKEQQTKILPTTNKTSKSVLRDSFMPEFSLIEGSQQTKEQQTKILPITNKTSKSVLRDSFMPEFSFIENSQPPSTSAAIQTQQQIKPINNSCLTNFSIMETSKTQQQQQNANSIKTTNKSFLPDFSYIPETQNNDSIIVQSQPLETRHLKQNSIKSSLQSSFLNSFTRSIADQQLKDNASNQWKQDGKNSKNLMDTYMKDFSEIIEPPPAIPKDIKEISRVQPSKNNSSLRFLNESLNQKSQISSKPVVNTSIEFSTTLNNDTKLRFLEPTTAVKKSPAKENKGSIGGNKSNDKYFELNCETEMFADNMSMIKNSTWLPNHGPAVPKITTTKQLSQLHEDSLHIKHEEKTPNTTTASISNLAQVSNTYSDSAVRSKLNFMEQSQNFSIDISCSELAAINAKNQRPAIQSKQISIVESPEQDEEDDCEMSIYYKKTPKTPKPQIHIWDDADAFKTPANNNYHNHFETDLNQTNQVIETICIDPNVNPFNVNLIKAFLEQVSFTTYIESLSNCMLAGCIQRLKQHSKICIKGVSFEVLKLIGEGSYGAVFCGKEISTGRLVAMKQEKPTNYWEYYICLEIAARIHVDEMLPAYMSIDHALIGNNSSILISDFSQYGSLISVCNKIKKHTLKNVDELVVMLLACELLELMDHLHAVHIIHADIKADNILLMNKLTYPPTQRCLQLIDFGVSIDMQLFKPGQTFSFVHTDNAFKCPEMRENRPWTYQLDLYGLASVFHVLLFGKYMDVEQKPNGIWMHKTHVPRYFNKSLWETIFKTLLNIRDCTSMPNLQELRALLKEEIEEREKYVAKMVMEFNKALN